MRESAAGKIIKRRRVGAFVLFGVLAWTAIGGSYWERVLLALLHTLPDDLWTIVKDLRYIIFATPASVAAIVTLKDLLKRRESAEIIEQREAEFNLARLATWADEVILIRVPLITFQENNAYSIVWEKALGSRKRFLRRKRPPILITYVAADAAKKAVAENTFLARSITGKAIVKPDLGGPEQYAVWIRREKGKIHRIITIGWNNAVLDLVIADASVGWVGHLANKVDSAIN